MHRCVWRCHRFASSGRRLGAGCDDRRVPRVRPVASPQARARASRQHRQDVAARQAPAAFCDCSPPNHSGAGISTEDSSDLLLARCETRRARPPTRGLTDQPGTLRHRVRRSRRSLDSSKRPAPLRARSSRLIESVAASRVTGSPAGAVSTRNRVRGTRTPRGRGCNGSSVVSSAVAVDLWGLCS